MHDPLDFERRPLLSLLERKRKLAALVLLGENLASAYWRIFSWFALFAGLWMLGIPDMLGTHGHKLFLVLFAIGFIYLLRKDARKMHWPSRHEIDRRLEKASNLHHRPLGVFEDTLVNARNEDTRKLWHKNKDTAFDTLKNVRMPLPEPVLASKDPNALRFLALFLLITGLVAAGPQWKNRIGYGLFPFQVSGAKDQPDAVTLWITPPEYTGIGQIIMQGSGKAEGSVKIPEKSIIKIRMAGQLIQPKLTMGNDIYDLEPLGENGWGLETEIKQADTLKLTQWGITRASIAYEYVIDQPPTIELTDAPETLSKGEIRLPIKAYDDYGVTDMTMTMDLDPMIEDKPLGTAYNETRAVMTAPGSEAELAPTYDLAWHPWAGLPVTITVEVQDHPGHTTKLPAIEMTLPERSFNHPIASQLVDMRKRLIWTPEAARDNVAYDLQDLLQQPEAFQFDPVVALAIRSASSRLAYSDKDYEAVARVIELLWDTALRIEEGDLPLAARNLRDAQRQLEQVLADPNATDQEVMKALEDMKMAMAEYFQELYREMQKRMAQNGQQMQISPEMMQNMLNPEDIASFLDQLQAEALSGDKDAARQLLSELQQFMDMLNHGKDMAMPPQMEFMMEGINEMQELIERQQSLLDQTRQQANRINGEQQAYPEFTPFDEDMIEDWGMGDLPPPPDTKQKPAPPEIDTSHNQGEQDALRYILGQLMLESDEQLGEIPENMGLAEQEMRKSAEQLGGNRPDQSIPHQEQAIAYLQEAMKDMSQQMQKMMQNMMMLSMGMGQMDPLGRPMQDGDQPGMFPGSRVKIPDEAARKRAQEILKILRQRSGEVERPDYELEYYRRLMKQF